MRLARFAPLVFALAAAAGAIQPAHAAAGPHALFAGERRASGGDAWNAVAAVRVDGVTVMGGAPSRFTQLTDRANGFTKATAVIGPVTDVSGYDGVAWDFQGSTATLQTLPGSVADNIAQAYVARDGWWYLSHAAGAHASAPFRLDPNVGWISTDVLVGGRPSHVIFDSGASNYFSAAAAAQLALRGTFDFSTSTVTFAPAARAGLRAGDRIVALNGASIASKKLGLSDATPFVRGSKTSTLTTQAKDGSTSTVTIHPRVLLP